MFQVQLAYDSYSISWGEPPSHVQIRRILSLKTWNSQASQTSFQMFPAMGQGTEAETDYGKPQKDRQVMNSEIFPNLPYISCGCYFPTFLGVAKFSDFISVNLHHLGGILVSSQMKS